MDEEVPMAETRNRQRVLVVGATGALGQKVVAALRARGKTVRALVRPGSEAGHIEGEGVEIVRGDMMEPASLDRAFAGVDAVITTAAGYTKRRSSDTDAIDTVGNQNLVDAAKRAGTEWFVLTSILASDRAEDVPHFWHKHLAERALDEAGVPHVALRPGAFLDQSVDVFAKGVRKGRIPAMGDRHARWSWVFTDDLARYLAEAVDLGPEWSGRRIDIGWDRPVSTDELAEVIAAQHGAPVRVWALPWPVVSALGAVAGLLSATVRDIVAMLRFFRSGAYVADTTLQARAFDVPTAEDAVGRWLAGHGLRAEPREAA